MNSPFAIAVRQAQNQPEIRAAVHNLYQSLQSQIDLRRPICRTSGRCCHFDEFGHRLYVTTAEMGTFIHDLARDEASNAHAGLQVKGGSLPILKSCPFQIDGLCSVHSIRPFGCRIFFCDATATDWQREQYEIFHALLKHIHEQFDIPYFYVEWRRALRELNTTT